MEPISLNVGCLLLFIQLYAKRAVSRIYLPVKAADGRSDPRRRASHPSVHVAAEITVSLELLQLPVPQFGNFAELYVSNFSG
jgi:hypothetical protein